MVTYNRPHEREIIPKERSPVLIRRRKVISGCAAAILAALLAAGPRSAVADTIRISGIGGAAETIRLLGEAFRKVRPDVRFVLLPSIGSEGAVKAVVAGDLDIGLCARPLTGEERARGAVETRYARTPLVFGVNRSIKTSGLTLASVVEIYAGKRNHWEDGSRVRLILRPPTDSDTPVLKRMSPEMDVAVESASRRWG
jgi:phosphate transport system substrate-binding protein